MAVSEQTPYTEYTANGSTKSFSLGFDCESQDHLIVLVDNAAPSVGAWSLSGGSVVFGTAPGNGKKITIQRNTPASRSTNYKSTDNSFRPDPINKDFDRAWWKIQELGIADWLLGLKIQKFRDDVNLTALENTLKQSRDIRDATSLLADEVQANTTQSATLLTNTTAKANAAATSATNANTAKTQAQQAVTDANSIKTDMYTALYSFQNGATKAYPTLAAATADIANIALDTKVTVLSETDGGDYYKATADATGLTKSPYDPLTQAKTYTDGLLPSYSHRSGYIGGYISESGSLLLGFRELDGAPIFGNGGDISLRLDNLEIVSEVLPMGRSGILWGLKNPDGTLPIYVDEFTGSPILAGVDVIKKLETIETALSSSTDGAPDFPNDNIVAWGDSLTGSGSSGAWTIKLAALTGRNVHDGGIGGQGSRQIAARQGGVPVRLSSFTIPADLTPVTVSPNGWTPCSKGGVSIQIRVNGVVGNLSRSAEDIHTFTRAMGGEPVAVPQGSMGVPTIGEGYRNRIQIIGSGRNSFRANTPDFLSPGQIVSAIKAMIDYQDSEVKRAIVWGVLPSTDDVLGSSYRTILDALNLEIKSAFPEYWLDIPTWLRTITPQTIGTVTVNDPFTQLGMTPTEQDLVDISNGITPSSFLMDVVHLNDAGGTAIAYRMNIELQLRGWV